MSKTFRLALGAMVTLAGSVTAGKNVWLIAVNDGVDSARNDNSPPFRNIMNEFFVRDTSRKIKFMFKAML